MCRMLDFEGWELERFKGWTNYFFYFGYLDY